jgi:hypothetical protein
MATLKPKNKVYDSHVRAYSQSFYDIEMSLKQLFFTCFLATFGSFFLSSCFQGRMKCQISQLVFTWSTVVESKE